MAARSKFTAPAATRDRSDRGSGLRERQPRPGAPRLARSRSSRQELAQGTWRRGRSLPRRRLQETDLIVDQGYVNGNHAPGRRDWREAAAVAKNLLKAHGGAVEVYRAGGYKRPI